MRKALTPKQKRLPPGRPTAERLVHRVEKDWRTGCWIWTAKRNTNGYGQIGINKRSWLAHRASYEAFVGPIPQGHYVCHHCDNPACINPLHLFIGTQRDNMRDMKRKGRAPVHTPPKGPKHWNAKYSTAQALSVASLLRQTDLPHREIAAQCGVKAHFVTEVNIGARCGAITGVKDGECIRRSHWHKEKPLAKSRKNEKSTIRGAGVQGVDAS